MVVVLMLQNTLEVKVSSNVPAVLSVFFCVHLCYIICNYGLIYR